MRRRALHVYPTPFVNDARTDRITRALTDARLFDTIDIGALGDGEHAEHELIDGNRAVWRVPLRMRRIPGTAGKLLCFAEWYARLLLRYRGTVDVVDCHSISVLPLGVLFKVMFGCRVIYSPHELETEQNVSWARTRFVKMVERALIRRAEAVVVVGDSIADWYKRTYRLNDVAVIRNIAGLPFADRPSSRKLRERTGISDDDLVFLYQGMIAPRRGVEIMLKAFSDAPSDRHLVLMGFGPLRGQVEEHASRFPNIHFIPAVPAGDIPLYTGGADVGFAFNENTSLNQYLSLPNRFFEYLHAGLAIIAGDLPEMRRIIQEADCGWVSQMSVEGVSSLVKGLSRSEIAQRAAASRAASPRYTWQGEAARLEALYRGLETAGRLRNPRRARRSESTAEHHGDYR